jgi:O-Antigen ligase
VNVYKINSILLNFYLYLNAISLLFSPLINDFIIKNTMLFMMIGTCLLLNKFKFNMFFLVYITSLVTYVLLNALLVSEKGYALADGYNLILYSFIPVYLFSQSLLKIETLLYYWYKFSLGFTFLIPIYYLLRIKGYISYYDLGLVAHLNIIIQSYNIFSSATHRKLPKYLLLFLNLVVVGVLGSRLVFLSSVLSIFLIYFLFVKKKSFKFFFSVISLTSISLIIYLNLIKILIFINSTINEMGLNSRNLTMFIAQLQGRYDDTTIVSGRDNIYPVILEYLKDHWFFPSGFGVARKLTNGAYYHSHNFILELLLIFGGMGLILFILGIIHRIYIVMSYDVNREKWRILIILFFSFFLRSLMGTHFVSDVIFLMSLGIFFSIKKETNQEIIIK